jgi:general secretion pathway protein K
LKKAKRLALDAHQNRGIALLVTITVITVLIVAALELNRRVRAFTTNTASARDVTTMTHMGASAVHAAMALLIKDKMESQADSLQEDWANPEVITQILAEIPFDRGQIDLSILDESAKIQVNALVNFPNSRSFNEPQYFLWNRFLQLYLDTEDDLDDSDPLPIINSLKDWLDSGDDDATTGLSGAESDYYRDLNPSYTCKNGPMTHHSELALVKGLTPQIVYGSAEKPGIIEFLTVYGTRLQTGASQQTYSGQININTAALPVLASLLPAGSEELAQLMVDYREEKGEETYLHNLSTPTWYKQVPGFSGIDIDPDLITTVSDIYRIVAKISLNSANMTVTAVVKREKAPETEKWRCRVLRWND